MEGLSRARFRQKSIDHFLRARVLWGLGRSCWVGSLSRSAVISTSSAQCSVGDMHCMGFVYIPTMVVTSGLALEMACPLRSLAATSAVQAVAAWKGARALESRSHSSRPQKLKLRSYGS